MSLYRAVRAVAEAEGDEPIDWNAVGAASRAVITPGDITLSSAQRNGYATDVREARTLVGNIAGIELDRPERIQIQNRHHWLEANLDTFQRLLAPLEEHTTLVPSVARSINTGTMAITLGFLANNVLGQYDPLLLAETDEHELYFVHPNIVRVATKLSVDQPRFRRWIIFHEVAHAAEFAAAPWLESHLEETIQKTVRQLADGRVDKQAITELNTTMTAVEGYAELLMDRAFDQEYQDLRHKLDHHRRNLGPIARVIRQMLGFDMKRRQYERGKAFFEDVADTTGMEGANLVWKQQSNLPTEAEFDTPSLWIDRMNL